MFFFVAEYLKRASQRGGVAMALWSFPYADTINEPLV